MSTPLLTDELWNETAPLLPPEPPKPKGGRPRLPGRHALTGILFGAHRLSLGGAAGRTGL